MDFSTPAKHMPSNPKKPLTLKEFLSSVADFRIDRRKKYPLYEILMITVCAMIDGARGPTDFWRFGRGKIGFLRKFLPLVNGIPSPDTFRRVLGKLDTKRFNASSRLRDASESPLDASSTTISETKRSNSQRVVSHHVCVAA